MKIPFLIAAAGAFLLSCNSSSTAKTFCDTTCTSDEIVFNGDAQFEQELKIKLKNCAGDSLSLTHGQTFTTKQIYLPAFLDKTVKINKSALSCYFQDTSQAWVSFNDCITGRGYLLKLRYDGNNRKISGALNGFDPKFSLDKDLRAYTDRGNLTVVNVVTGKEANMTFGKEYDINFDKIHEGIDTLNVTKQRMYIVLKDKDGKQVPFEKKIEL